MKNLSKLFLTQCFLWASLIGFTQQPQWYIKNTDDVNHPIVTNGTSNPSVLFDFRQQLPVIPALPTINDDNLRAIYQKKEADNAIYDENGNLEIFIAHDAVYNAQGIFQNFLVRPNYSWYAFDVNTTTQDYDLAICRVPESCSKYYIIRYGTISGLANYELHYFIYDINTNAFENQNGVPYPYTASSSNNYVEEVPGIPITGVNGLSNVGQLSDYHLAVTKLNSNNERFLFWGTNKGVYQASISNTGITFLPNNNNTSGSVFFGAGTSYGGSSNEKITAGDNVYELEVIQLSNGAYRLARVGGALSNTTNKRVFVININNDGTVNTSNPVHYYSYTGNVKGVEFSPDGKYLYITKTTAPYIQYVDVTQPNASFQTLNLPSTINSAPDKEKYHLGSIEIAHNGKMYFASSDGLSSFSEPNDPTLAASLAYWTDNEVQHAIDGFMPSGGLNQQLIPLPEQVDGELLYTPMTNLGPFLGCGNSVPQGCVTDYPGFEYIWFSANQGNGVGFPMATGPCFQPPAFGTYVVKVTDENNCSKSYNVEFKNDIIQLPQLEDIYYCSLTEPCPMVGWNLNLYDYPNITSTEWYYNGNIVNTGNAVDLMIPCQAEGVGEIGEYTVIVNSACGSQTFTFTVTDVLQEFTNDINAALSTLNPGSDLFVWAPSNLNYSYTWTVTNNLGQPVPFTIEASPINGSKIKIFAPNSYPHYPLSFSVLVSNPDECETYTDSYEEWSPGESTGGGDDENPWGRRGMTLNTYPNPVNDIVNLTLENASADNYEAALLSIDGRVLMETSIVNSRSAIDMSDLAPGTYFVKVFNELESVTSKIIKQ